MIQTVRECHWPLGRGDASPEGPAVMASGTYLTSNGFSYTVMSYSRIWSSLTPGVFVIASAGQTGNRVDPGRKQGRLVGSRSK
jgi:hypothetical protein